MSKSLLVGILSAFLVLQGCSSALPKPPPIDSEVELQTAWQIGVDARYGKPGARLNLLADEGDLFFVTDRGTVYQVVQDDGRKKVFIYTDYEPSTGVTRNGDTLYYGTFDAKLVAVSISEEKVLWEKPLSSEILSESAYAAGKLAVQTADGWLSVLDASNGEILWRVKEDLPALTIRGTSVPVISEGKLIVGLANGELKTYDLNSGDLLWSYEVGKPEGRYEIERLSDVDGRLAVKDGIVYAAAYNGTLVALSISTGRPVWQRSVSSSVGVAISGDVLSVVDVDSKVLAFNAKNGSELWSNESLADRDLLAPVFLKDYVAVLDRGSYVHLLDLVTGEVKGRRIVEADVPYGGRMVSNGDKLFVITAKAGITAFSYRNY
ncbi:outer membrane protein assembly factor BamB [Marinomonas dokdonensis]|uniref:outer membrane protein assembly factor BamB n=1 Tax=Marinomonas dokdonensis TaxID=328224 RepID=UPI0040558B6B